MKRFALPIVAVAVALLAACGGTTSSSAKLSGNVGAVQLQPGVNAGSDISDLGRVNTVVRKSAGRPIAPAPAQPGPANPTQPSTSGQDRCTTGFGSGSAGSPRAGIAGGKHLPQPMCLVE
jgi:hypothetical protein